MARPTAGLSMIDPLPGSPEAKTRLVAILATISGEYSIADACDETGVGEARFFVLRRDFLEAAIGLLEKRPAGRKPLPRPDAELERLREENARLRLEVQAARIRAEIGVVMPHALRPAPPAPGKKRARRK